MNAGCVCGCVCVFCEPRRNVSANLARSFCTPCRDVVYLLSTFYLLPACVGTTVCDGANRMSVVLVRGVGTVMLNNTVLPGPSLSSVFADGQCIYFAALEVNEKRESHQEMFES